MRRGVDFFTLGSLASGATQTYMVTYRASAGKGTTILLGGAISGTPDPSLKNNLAVQLLKQT